MAFAFGRWAAQHHRVWAVNVPQHRSMPATRTYSHGHRPVGRAASYLARWWIEFEVGWTDQGVPPRRCGGNGLVGYGYARRCSPAHPLHSARSSGAFPDAACAPRVKPCSFFLLLLFCFAGNDTLLQTGGACSVVLAFVQFWAAFQFDQAPGLHSGRARRCAPFPARLG